MSKSHDCDGDCSQTKVLVPDEPTNDLDPVTQSQILRLLSRMNRFTTRRFSSSGHDLTTITQWAARIHRDVLWPVSRISGYSQTVGCTKALYRRAAQSDAGLQRLDSTQRKIAVAAGVEIPPFAASTIGCRLGPLSLRTKTVCRDPSYQTY